MPSTGPDFDAWVDYCFTRGYREFQHPELDASDSFAMPPERLAEFMIRLFENPSGLAERFTDPQIDDGVWFLFGIASGYVSEVLSDPVPEELQRRYLRAVGRLYTEFFDRVCGNRGESPDDERLNEKVDCGVYMIWDMDQLQWCIADRPDLFPEAEGIFGLVLKRCLTSGCLASALHGVGELIGPLTRRGRTADAARLQTLVDEFLARRRPPAWIAEYAAQARTGNIL